MTGEEAEVRMRTAEAEFGNVLGDEAVPLPAAMFDRVELPEEVKRIYTEIRNVIYDVAEALDSRVFPRPVPRFGRTVKRFIRNVLDPMFGYVPAGGN